MKVKGVVPCSGLGLWMEHAGKWKEVMRVMGCVWERKEHESDMG